MSCKPVLNERWGQEKGFRCNPDLTPDLKSKSRDSDRCFFVGGAWGTQSTSDSCCMVFVLDLAQQSRPRRSQFVTKQVSEQQ